MLALAVTAELNGRVLLRGLKNRADWIPSVTELQPQDEEGSPFYYTFKVQCTSCREVHPNWVSVSRFVSPSNL